MSSDSTGEIYVLTRSTATTSGTASGTIVTPTATASAKNSASSMWSRDVSMVGLAVLVGTWLTIF